MWKYVARPLYNTYIQAIVYAWPFMPTALSSAVCIPRQATHLSWATGLEAAAQEITVSRSRHIYPFPPYSRRRGGGSLRAPESEV
jgi:hypothetical protein